MGLITAAKLLLKGKKSMGVIKSKLGDEYASNQSYEEYYKDLI